MHTHHRRGRSWTTDKRRSDEYKMYCHVSFEKLTLCVRLLFSFPLSTFIDVTRTPPTSLVLWVFHWCQYELHHKFQGHKWENTNFMKEGQTAEYRCPYQPLPLLPIMVPVFGVSGLAQSRLQTETTTGKPSKKGGPSCSLRERVGFRCPTVPN